MIRKADTGGVVDCTVHVNVSLSGSDADNVNRISVVEAALLSMMSTEAGKLDISGACINRYYRVCTHRKTVVYITCACKSFLLNIVGLLSGCDVWIPTGTH